MAEEYNQIKANHKRVYSHNYKSNSQTIEKAQEEFKIGNEGTEGFIMSTPLKREKGGTMSGRN